MFVIAVLESPMKMVFTYNNWEVGCFYEQE